MYKKLGSILVSAVVLLSCIPSISVSAQNSGYNYGEALQKSIFFYDFQRSGTLPDDKKDNWRGDSGLNDGADAGLDLTGGLYDAGDHVKFNLPMAYTSTMLAWSAYEDKQALADSGQLDSLLDTVKWITDYLIKCHPQPNVFYYQVGDGGLDHAWWGPAEVMQMNRPSYKVDLSNPGSTVAGEAAAALASAAIVFKDIDAAYSQLCLEHAKQLFSFADTTKSDAGYTAANGYYNSWSGFYDQLSWAGAWLYIATDDLNYLNKAESYVSNWGTEPQTTTIAYKWAHCWDDVHNGAALLLAKLTDNTIYKATTEMHLDYWTTGYAGNRVTYTPDGLAWLDSWGALRYATTTAFLAGVYADWENADPVKAQTYKTFAKQQVDYALGSSGRSYVVDFGENSPEHPHHRTAHSSWADSQTAPDYHRHTIIGALVGGPDQNDGYSDTINNYVNNEVANDYNAGFVGALAKMYKWYGGTPIENLTAVEEITNDEFYVEAGINASGQNFMEIKALLYNKSGWPARVGDKLSFKYFIDISEGVALGYNADDYTISTSYNGGATVSELLPWDAANNIYYVNVDFSGTKIYPGGQSAFKKEVQIRIAAPQNTRFWNNSNDFSYQDIGSYVNGSTVKTSYIPVYDDGTKVYGSEPGNGQNNSTISPTSTSFDKYTANQNDVEVSVNYNGNTINAVKNGSSILTQGTDYVINNDNTISIKKSYLSTLPTGTLKLTFMFSAGNNPTLSIEITDSTPSASISPVSAVFDVAEGFQEDIDVTLNLNGHILAGIYNQSNPLIENMDYMVQENTVTILKAYLSQKSVGNHTLTFVFSAGNNASLSIRVINSSITVSGDVSLEMFNGSKSATLNGIAPRFRITNTGDNDINLSDVTLRYYYTIDGEKAQNFWCDWSSAGTSNVKGSFVKLNTPLTGADYYLEVGFTASAGTLAVGQSVEVQTRFSKTDWTDYTQTDDYSFNSSANSYTTYDKVTAYVSGNLAFGVEP